MTTFYQTHKRLIDRVAFFSLIIAAVYIFFVHLFSYIAPFFAGFVISLLMEPLIRLLAVKVRISRPWASLICLLLFLAAAGGLGTLIVSNLYRQIVSFVNAAPQIIDDAGRRLDDVNEWLSAWTDSLSGSLYMDFPDSKETLLTGLTALFGDGVKDQSLRIVSNVPDFFVGIILTLVSAYFFMKDRERVFGLLSAHCPVWLARNLNLIRRGLSRAVGGYFRAQFILMSIVGIIGISGLLILRNPYALLIGLTMALLDFLPIMGSGLLLLPWSLVSLLSGQYRMTVGLLILYGVITVTRQILEPKILGEQIGVHPLITLMSVYVGFKIFGIFGIIIGPSLAIVFKAIREAERKGG